jgi:hypothetical protein
MDARDSLARERMLRVRSITIPRDVNHAILIQQTSDEVLEAAATALTSE